MQNRPIRLAALSSYLPEKVISNHELLAELEAPFELPRADVLERLFGIQYRRRARSDEQASDLAAAAARPILANLDPSSIDLLIFASACADLIEPATANIVQAKLGLRCPVFDLKNACNSFVSAIETASAFLRAGMAQRVLIVAGEKPSDSIRKKWTEKGQLAHSISALTLGDAGAAFLLENSDGPDGFFWQKSMTVGQHWRLCQIPGGGTMHPADAEKLFFEGKTAELREVIFAESNGFVRRSLAEIGWQAAEVDRVITHQVSVGAFAPVAAALEIGVEKVVSVFPQLGNMAAASVPVSLASVAPELKKGEKIVVVGLAAGISVSVAGLVW